MKRIRKGKQFTKILSIFLAMMMLISPIMEVAFASNPIDEMKISEMENIQVEPEINAEINQENFQEEESNNNAKENLDAEVEESHYNEPEEINPVIEDNHNNEITNDVGSEISNTPQNTEALPPSTFSLHWVSGGDNTSSSIEGVISGNYLEITPKNNFKTRSAIYQLSFTLGKERNAKPGEIEIRVPMHIFYGRDGKPVDRFEIPVPKAPNTSELFSFNYTIDEANQEIVLTNYREFTGNANMTLDLKYDFWPYQVKDGYINPEIEASVKFKDVNALDSKTNPLSVKVNTDANLYVNSKEVVKRTNTWDNAWGEKPADADEHFFILWRINFQASPYSTQPFEIKRTDVANPVGEVVAFSKPKKTHVTNSPPLEFLTNEILEDGSDTISNYAFQVTENPNNANNENRNFYIVTKYKKELGVPGKVFENRIDFNLTGVDGATAHSYKIARYTYRPDAQYSGDRSTAFKNTASTIQTAATLNALLNGSSVDLLGANSQTFRITTNTTAYDVSNKGESDYTIEIIDNIMGLRQSVVNNEPTEPFFDLLEPGEDFNYLSLNISYDEYNFNYSESSGYISDKATDYQNYKPVEIFVQRNNSTEWEKFGEILRVGSSSSSYYFYPNDGGARKIAGKSNPIKLPVDVTNIKYSHTSNRFAVQTEATFGIRINGTDKVIAAINKAMEAGDQTIDFYNISTYGVKNSEGVYVGTSNELQIGGKAYYPEEVWDRVREQDLAIVGEEGKYLKHWNAGVTLKKAEANNEIRKTNKTPIHDNDNRREIISYSVVASEYAYLNKSAVSPEQALEWDVIKEQKSGVFYDLLPKATWAVNDSIKVYTLKARYDGLGFRYEKGVLAPHKVEFIPNWKNTGMTMMKVEVTSPVEQNTFTLDGAAYGIFSGFIMDFDVYNYHDNIIDNGKLMLNSVAYHSLNGELAKGKDDSEETLSNLKGFEEGPLFVDVNEDGQVDKKEFLYAQNIVNVNPLIATEIETTKKVKSLEESEFGDLSEVPVGGEYIYRIRFTTDRDTTATNVVLYDVLEEAHGNKEHWKGVFDRVDVSRAEAMGIKPVVYYSTVNNLDTNVNDSHADLSDTNIWTTEIPANKSSIKAVAIDMTKAADGSDYQFKQLSNVSVFIHMKAPNNDVDDIVKEQLLTYNKTNIRAKNYLEDGIGTSVDVNEYTNIVSVKLRDVVLRIEKGSDPDSGTHEQPQVIDNKLIYTIKIYDDSLKDDGKDIKAIDNLPEGLKLAETPKYSFEKDLNGEIPGSTGDVLNPDENFDHGVAMTQDGQKLTFTIKQLKAGNNVTITIPVEVDRSQIPLINEPIFQNTAEIISVEGRKHEVTSNTVYHKAQFPTERVVKKVWNDLDENGNPIIARPDFIEVNLLADGEMTNTIRLNSENNWEHKWENLPYKNEDGSVIKYSIEEKVPNDYTSDTREITNPTTGEISFVITNSLSLTNRTVTKTWTDNDDALGIRPDHVNIQLTQNGENYRDPITLNEENGWSYVFEDLPKYKDGKEIEYNITEDQISPYKTNINQEIMENGDIIFVVNNVLETKELTIVKLWDDLNNEYEARPDSVEIQLFREKSGGVKEEVGDEIELNESNEWKHKFENLIKSYVDESGQFVDYLYTVEEIDVPDKYISKVENIQDDYNHYGFVITNQLKTISVTGVKNWVGGPDEKPEISLQLMQDDREYGDPVELSNGQTSYTWTDVEYKDEDGKEFVYTISEVDVPDRYDSVLSADGLTVTNTWKPLNKKIDVTATKTWVGGPDTKPDITLQLYDGDKAYGDPVILSNGQESYTWNDLWYEDLQGKVHEYTVKELEFEGNYTSEFVRTVDEDGHVMVDFTNSWIKSDAKIKVQATKNWVGGPKDKPNVVLQLLRDGVDYLEPVTLIYPNLTHTWEELELEGDKGINYNYTVKEVDVPEDYTSATESVTDSDGNVEVTIHNNYQETPITVTANKVWEGGPEVKPDIQLQLLQNAYPLGEPVTLSNGETSHTWEDLKQFDDNGELYVYTVQEIDAPEGYKSSISQDGLIITNTWIEVMDIEVNKNWEGGREPRPAIKVYLDRDGRPYDEITLESGETTYTWENLRVKNDHGEPYVYSVREEVLGGYETKIETDSKTEGKLIFNITNTFIIEKVDITGKKIWVNVEGEKPDIDLQLYQNGTPLGNPITFKNGISEYTWKDLVKYDENDELYVYTIKEVKVPDGYKSQVLEDGLTVVNTLIEVENITATKIWMGGPKNKPDIEIQLYRNGIEFGESITLKSGTNSYTWKGLEKLDEDGNEYVYTVKELKVPDGYKSKVLKNGLTIVNSWIKPDGPKPPVDPDDPKPPVDPDDPKPPVDPDDPKPPVDPSDPKPPVKPGDPKPPVKPVDPKPPVKPVIPKKPPKVVKVLPKTGSQAATALYVGIAAIAIGTYLFRKKKS